MIEMASMTVKIIVAAHKKYEMPVDSMYIPLHVGAAGKKDADGNNLDIGFIKDNCGDNISNLNSSFCELTGLYWAWKNLDADYIGLVHYRRHFSMRKKRGFENVLTYQELKPYLGKIKVFVPQKRKYYIETLYSHYKHTHYASHLNITKKVIERLYPEYNESYNKIIKHTYGYMFNMMIMHRDLLNDYCTWLFNILFELTKQIDVQGLSDFQGRYLGRVSEIIFNVWLEQKIVDGKLKRKEIKEIPCIHMEKVNWPKKAVAFLRAKFSGKRYEKSF